MFWFTLQPFVWTPNKYNELYWHIVAKHKSQKSLRVRLQEELVCRSQIVACRQPWWCCHLSQFLQTNLKNGSEYYKQVCYHYFYPETDFCGLVVWQLTYSIRSTGSCIYIPILTYFKMSSEKIFLNLYGSILAAGPLLSDVGFLSNVLLRSTTEIDILWSKMNEELKHIVSVFAIMGIVNYDTEWSY